MREESKNLWTHREISVFHLIQKIPVLTLLNEEQKNKHHIRDSVLISALQSQEGA